MPRFISTKFNGVYYSELKRSLYNGKPDKCFYIKYYADGKRYMKKIGKASEGYTAQSVANLKAEKMTNNVKDLTFNDLYNNFMEWAIHNKKSWKSNKTCYFLHIKEYIGNMQVKDITSKHINNVLIKMKNTGKPDGTKYAPQTIKHILLLIKRIFNYNIEMEVIKNNPAINIKLERFDNTRIAYLYEDEIERMFEYLDSGKEWCNDAALIKFAFFTGLRKSELFKLIWKNVDIDNKRIFLYDTKGGKNEAVILTESAVQILLDIKDKCSDDIYVFPSIRGGKRDDIKKLWTRIKKAAGIRPEIRFHDIRHTFGTLATATLPVKIVQKMMTHKDIKTTLRYAHIQEKEMINAANELDSFFNNFKRN